MVKRVETGHPNIFRYENGDLYYRGQINGRRREINLHTQKQRTAEKEIIKLGLRTDLDAKDEVLYNFTGDLIPEFLEWKQRFIGHDDPKRAITQETFNEYEDLFRLYLTPFYGNKSLLLIAETNKDGEEVQWHEFKKTVPTQLINVRKVWMAFKKWAYEQGHIRKIGTIAKPTYQTKGGRILEPAELKAFLTAASSHDNLFLFILMGSTMAMRRSEIVKLSWDRVLFKEKAVVTKSRGTRTKTKRTIAVNDDVLEILKARKAQSQSPFVFPNRRDQKRHADVSGLKKVWAQAVTAAGIKGRVTPHDLRRTWAVFANLDPSLTDMQREKFAGHSRDIQRDHYALLTAKHLKPLTEVVPISGLSKMVSNHLKIGGQSGGRGGKVK